MNSRERGWLLPPAALFFAGGILLGRQTSSASGAVMGFLMALAAFFLLRHKARFCALMIMMVSIGCLCGFRAWHPVLPEAGEYRISGIIAEEPQADSLRIRTVLSNVTLNGKPYPSGAYWSMYTDHIPEGFLPGKQVSFSGRLYHPSGAENPDGYDFREELLRQGVTVGVFGMTDLQILTPDFFSFPGWTAGIRHNLILSLTRTLGEDAGNYAAALLLGYRSLISGEDRSAFSRLGIAHILSVSGFHVGVLISVLAGLFKLLHLSQKLRLFFYALLLALYCGLCGFSQPVIRASLLVLFSIRGKILARPRSGLHLLSAVFILMLFFSPVQLTGLSFRLSFGAMLGLTVVTPFLHSLWKPSSVPLSKGYDGLCAGIGAQLGILLPELSTFQQFPLLGLLANIPVLIYSSFLILLDWIVLLTLPFQTLSSLLCPLSRAATDGLVSTVRFLGHLPGIALWTPASNAATGLGLVLVFIGLCGLLRLRKAVRWEFCSTGSLILVISLCPLPHHSTEYWQFSVGNADAAVLWDHDKVYLIDTGYNDHVVSSFLQRRRLVPDAIILTHLHADHVGGLTALRDSGIPISLCYIPEGAEDADIHPDIADLLLQLRADGTEIRELSAGNQLIFPSGSASVIWPEHGKTRPNQDANESCLVLRFELMGVSMLQAGDLDGRYEMYAAVPSDLLKIAHHGSPNSSSQSFLDSVSPQAVLLSCEQLNRHEQVQDRLNGIPLYSTSMCGALTVRFAPSAFTVETFLPLREDD